MISLFNRSDGNSPGLISSLREGNYGPHLIIFSVVASSVSILTALSLSFSYGKLASKPQVTLAQTNDGVISIKEQDYLYRAPNNIRDFTGQTLSMLLNWSGQTINQYGVIEKDQGIEVGQQSKIPTMAYEASHAFTTDGRLRSQVIERLAKWSDDKYFQGSKEQRLEIKKIMIPQALDKKGHWRVNVIATRVISQAQSTEPIEFNRTLFIRAVPIISNPIPESSTPEQKAFYKVRQQGLEIYRMQKFTREDL